MKRLLFIPLVLIIHSALAYEWTRDQLDAANTAGDISYLTTAEREAVMYINLARLFPKEFAKEVEGYYGTAKYGDYLIDSPYRNSLIQTLNAMTPVQALKFDEAMYRNAKCFAKESGDAGTTGHKRIKCPKENYAECCSYGMDTGKDIAMQWLIDDDVPSLGHRINCLDGAYSKIAVAVHKHIKWDICAVAEIIW